MRAFWYALQLLSRLPTPSLPAPRPRELGRSVVFYPWIGLVIGVALATLGHVLQALPPSMVAALVLLSWVLITGALHLDGLADSADAWLGSHGDKRRALAIMKDPRSGPAGITAVVMVLIIKFAALSALAATNRWLLVACAPTLGRAAIVLLFATTRYVRARGMGRYQSIYLPHQTAMMSLITVLIVMLWAVEWHALVSLLAAMVSIVMLRRLLQRRLGGVTGDTLGASCEIVEAVVLVALVLSVETWPHIDELLG